MKPDPVDYHIRPIESLKMDWPLLLPLLEAFEEHHRLLQGGPPRVEWQERTRKRLRRLIESGRGRVLLAYANDDAVGTAQGALMHNPMFVEERVGVLGNFYIDEAHRGSPLLAMLHRHLEDWFRAHGCTAAQRTVLVANERTRRLWRHRGFEPVMEIMRKPL